MDKGLLKQAVIKYVSGVILTGVLVFLPAWDLRWRSGWILMAVLFVPMFFAGIVMYVKVPDLLRSRLSAKETQSEQRDVIRYSGLMFLASFIVAGLYGIVRHPMYTATVFLFLSMPLILGSLPSFIIMLAYVPIIAKRIRNEEAVLEAELKGYAEYKNKVRYRLIPLIW